MTEKRSKRAPNAAQIRIAAYSVLALLQAAAGVLSQSRALIADAVHSASCVIGLFADRGSLSASKAHNEEARREESRFWPVASIIFSVLILVIGIEVGVSALKAILQSEKTAPHRWALYIIVISIVVKEAAYQIHYRFEKRLSIQAQNPRALCRRSGSISSVAAFAGIGGALVGEASGNTFLYVLDPLAAMVSSGMVIWMGYRMLTQSIYSQAGHLLNQEDAADLLETVQRIKGVIAIDELQAKEQGHYVIVDVKISVNPKITIQEGHEIAKIIKHTLMKRFIHVSDVIVHVYPYDPGYPYKDMDAAHDDIPTLLH